MLDELIAATTKTDIAGASLVLIFLLLAWFQPRFGDGLLTAFERAGARLAHRKLLAIAGLTLLTLLIRIALLPVMPLRPPYVHDEFSYLLAADTFAHSRLANPPHPMWIFFDTFQVNQHPMYMSKYPPAQGAVLAIGELLGNPWIGVLLSCAAMCGAVLWMLQGWLPPRWALLGGVLVALQIGIFTYWMNSFWGGAVAAIGGALVVGALPRIFRFQRPRDAIILGFGAGILANSRPYEGLVLCLPVAAALLAWLCGRRSPGWRVTLPRVALPLAAVALLCGLFMGYYNWRGTGNALLFPHVANHLTYQSAPIFLWEKARHPLHYLNPQFEDFYNRAEYEMWMDGRVGSLRDAARHLVLLAKELGHFFFWLELCLPLLALLPWLGSDRRIRFLLILAGVSFLGLFQVAWVFVHYAAPITATLFALVTQGMRHLRKWQVAGRPVGIGLSRAVVLLAVLLAPIHSTLGFYGKQRLRGIEYRPQLEARLSALPGEHLVMVRYGEDHNLNQEWVYNRADIDHAKVVWAREIPGVDTAPLLSYFRERHLWLLEADEDPPRLRPCHNGLESCGDDDGGSAPDPQR